jgi:hypothetical protein
MWMDFERYTAWKVVDHLENVDDHARSCCLQGRVMRISPIILRKAGGANQTQGANAFLCGLVVEASGDAYVDVCTSQDMTTKSNDALRAIQRQGAHSYKAAE